VNFDDRNALKIWHLILVDEQNVLQSN